jgi:hypothetical protein
MIEKVTPDRLIVPGIFSNSASMTAVPSRRQGNHRPSFSAVTGMGHMVRDAAHARLLTMRF